MKKVFIRNVEDEIEYIHMMPFHEVHGLKKSEEELNQDEDGGKVVYLDRTTRKKVPKGYKEEMYFDESDQIVKFRLVEKEETDDIDT